MNTLVFGGSVFVGRHLVDLLVAEGHQVAVLNRGQTASSFGSDVERLVADRTDPDQLRTWRFRCVLQQLFVNKPNLIFY